MNVARGESWTMFHGDCIEILPLFRQYRLMRWDAATRTSVHASVHIITDPPYDAHVHAKSRRGGADDEILWSGEGRISKCSFSRAHDFGFDAITGREMTEVSALIADIATRWVLVFSNVELTAGWRSRLTRFGLDYVRTGEWRKEAATPQFSGDRPAVAFEAITICHPKGRKKWNAGGKHGAWSARVAGNQPGSIRPRVHTAQKPLELMLDLVRDFTDEGDFVVDPYAGSGTTGIAALRLGRRFVGVERDEKYFRLACEELAAEARGTTRAADRAQQTSMFERVSP